MSKWAYIRHYNEPLAFYSILLTDIPYILGRLYQIFADSNPCKSLPRFMLLAVTCT
ncbi:MAG: hypothetical protein QM487_03355 [Candidatus Marithrix sp.]